MICENYNVYVVTCVACHQQYCMLAKQYRIFLREGQRAEVLGINQIIGITAAKWSYSVFHGIINKPPIYESYSVTFVEQPSFDLVVLEQDVVSNQVVRYFE